MNELIFVAAKSGKPYESTYMGIKHLVVPVVLLVEGVLRPGNIKRDELCLAEEFEKLPEAWDGRPVVLDHPADGPSANTPLNLENNSFGLLFNTQVDGKKLKSEAWINEDRVSELGGEIEELVEAIKDGEQIEISTGLYSFTEQRSGVFNGKSFDGVWRHIVPDHLAMLPKGLKGACSIDMGCGANRANSSDATFMDEATHQRYHAVANKLPTPKKGEKQDDFHSRCMGNKTMNKEFPDQKQRNAVCYSQWRSKKKNNAAGEETMQLNHNCTCGGTCDKCKGAISKSDAKNVSNFVAVMLREAEFSYLENISISDNDRRASLTAAISDYMEDNSGGGGYYYYYIIAVFDDIVVYATYEGLYACEYTMDDTDGATELTGEPYEVRPLTQFVPVSDPDEETDGSAEGVQNRSTSSEEHVMTEREKAAQAELAKNAAAEHKKEIDEAVAKALAAYDEEQKKKAPKNFDEYVAQAPEDIREQLVEGNRVLSARKSEIVKQLSEHKSKAFTKEELEKMNIGDLERMARIAGVNVTEAVDFSGRPMPAAPQNAEESSSFEEDTAPRPIRVFNYGPDVQSADGKNKKAKEETTQA